jgi:hypothetical protein
MIVIKTTGALKFRLQILKIQLIENRKKNRNKPAYEKHQKSSKKRSGQLHGFFAQFRVSRALGNVRLNLASVAKYSTVTVQVNRTWYSHSCNDHRQSVNRNIVVNQAAKGLSMERIFSQWRMSGNYAYLIIFISTFFNFLTN